MPQTTTLTYLVGDHLSSTSLAVDASTGDVIETRYKAWGEVRWTSENKSLPTRYTFTGQYSYVSDTSTDLGAAGFGLMFYNARWYDPYLNRFIQADSIVPGGVQGLDRYAYTANNPVNYVDPSGHAPKNNPYWCVNARNPSQCRQGYYLGMKMKQDKWEELQDTMSHCASGQATPEECQALIDDTLKYFNLDTNLTEGSGYGGVTIIFDPDRADDAGTHTEVGQDGKVYFVIQIGRKAFASRGWLGSSIDHELCHVKQHLGSTCQTYAVWTRGRKSELRTVGKRDANIGSEGWFMMEVEAYDYEISRAKYFGLTTDEVKALFTSRKNYYSSMTSSDQDRANVHFYCVEKWCHPDLNYYFGSD